MMTLSGLDEEQLGSIWAVLLDSHSLMSAVHWKVQAGDRKEPLLRQNHLLREGDGEDKTAN